MTHQLRYFPITLLALLAVTFSEKIIFALQHPQSGSLLEWWEPIYALLWGVRFDLAIASLLALLAYLLSYLLNRLTRLSFHNTIRSLTLAGAALLTVVHGADLLYYDEAGRHLGYELKEAYNSANELAMAAINTYTLPVLFQLLLLALATYLILFLFSRIKPKQPSTHSHHSILHWLRAELQLLPVLLFSILLIRGGLQSAPLEPLHAQMIGNPYQATLALNGAYNALFSSIASRHVQPVITTLPDNSDLKRVQALYSHADFDTTAKPPLNIIMVLLESWNASFMAPYGYDKVTTPFFDSLRDRGLTTQLMLAGGTRTTEGMFSSLCSMQNPLGRTVAQTQLQDFDYLCLPRQLREQGYYTAFFQGTSKNTSGTGAFAQMLGFSDSFGKRDIKSTRYPHNYWGVHDPDLYNFVLEQIDKADGPFFITINTNSTHDKVLPPGIDPFTTAQGKTAEYLNVLHFADSSLAEFTAALEERGLMENTLLVLTADHSTGMNASSKLLMRRAIPFVIIGAGVTTTKLDFIATQRDIAPTLQQLLGSERSPWFSGRSLLTAGGRHVADTYIEGLLAWTEDNQLVHFPINEPDKARCETIDKTATSNCDIDRLVQDALAFTRTSQSLLFSGQTREFPAMAHH
ncbi:MAG: sulfatase-like hydrolase/transferase [Gammaproteobacteria bacterium]|nr:sulfatase-like hydrolase/transferase [Gammaproteobacteria bacterium]